MLLKIGIRNNMRYPLLFILFKCLLDFNEMFKRIFCDYYKGYFICCTLIFLSQFLSGLFPLLKSKFKKGKKTIKQKVLGFKLIQGKGKIKAIDNYCKIIFLLFLASYFNLIGTIVRRKYFSQINEKLPKRGNFTEFRFKSIQIEVSALLSYLTIKIKLYKHQLVSLITIFIILILIMIIDIIDDYSDLLLKFKYFALTAFTCMARSFLDTIEKYLFEFDYLEPYVILIFEGLIGTIFNPMLLLIDDESYEDFKEIKGLSNEKPKLILLIILFILFLIISSFKNMYRVLTVQYYSPMTRALAESILDPFILLYHFFLNEKSPSNFIYFFLIIFCLTINALCSLVYNDFIVVYCCGMEHDTYLEINKRLFSSLNYNDSILNENDSDSDENDNDVNEKEITELNLNIKQ